MNKITDTIRLNFILAHYRTDTVDSWTEPLDPNPPPEKLMVFDLQGATGKMKPRSLDEDFREMLDRAIEDDPDWLEKQLGGVEG
jgi:hypothetical protein